MPVTNLASNRIFGNRRNDLLLFSAKISVAFSSSGRFDVVGRTVLPQPRRKQRHHQRQGISHHPSSTPGEELRHWLITEGSGRKPIASKDISPEEEQKDASVATIWRVCFSDAKGFFPMVFQMLLECFLLSPTNDEALRPDVELCWLHRCWSWLWGIWPFCWDKATVAWQHLDMQISILGRLAECLKWSPIVSFKIGVKHILFHRISTFTWSSSFVLCLFWCHGAGELSVEHHLKVFSVGPGPRWWPGWKSFRPTGGQIPWGVSQNYGKPPETHTISWP